MDIAESMLWCGVELKEVILTKRNKVIQHFMKKGKRVNHLKKYWKKYIKWGLFLLACILIVLFIINNYCKPVRMSEPFKRPIGGVYSDREDESKITAHSIFHIKNHSMYEQKVTFVLYQDNIWAEEDCLFDIDYIDIEYGKDSKVRIENGIVKVPAGQQVRITIDATAIDSSKAITSRSGPMVKIVTIR